MRSPCAAGDVYMSYEDTHANDQAELAASHERRQTIENLKRFIKEFFRKEQDDTLIYR